MNKYREASHSECRNPTGIWILFFQTFFIMWILNVCIGFTHHNDTEKNKINKFFVELYQDC